MSNKVRLDDWQKESIERLYKEGKSQREIAHYTGVGLKTVNKYCQDVKNHKTQNQKNEVSCNRVKINLSKLPTVDTVKSDILILYRHSLAELDARLPNMTDSEVYQLSMALLNSINGGGNNES